MPAVDDFKSFNKFDQAVLGLGALGLIVSFLPFYGYSFSGGAGVLAVASNSINAWHGAAFLGMLLFLAATAIAAMRLFAPASLPKLPIGINLLTLGLSALGALLVILRGVTYKHASGGGASLGLKWGAYLLFIVMIGQAVAAFMLFKSSGEVMPDFKAMQANKTAGAVQPPAYGTTPPPPAATYPPATPAGDFTLDDTNPPPK